MTDDQHANDTGPDRELTDPTFEELFSALREAGNRPAPPIGPDLAALLSSGVAPGLRRRRTRAATVGLVVVGVVAGGVGAAAATGHLQVPTGADTHLVDRRTPRTTTDDKGAAPSPTSVPSPATAASDPGQDTSTESDPAQEDTTDTPPAPAHHRTPHPSQGPATNGEDDDETGDDQSGEDQGGGDQGGGDQSDEDEDEGHGSDDSNEGQGPGTDDSNDGGSDDTTRRDD